MLSKTFLLSRKRFRFVFDAVSEFIQYFNEKNIYV